MVDTRSLFQRVYCINLHRRLDRWRRFQTMCHDMDWPFAQPRRFIAIDSRRCAPPAWWRDGAGAWGCYRSHLNIIEQCLNDRVRRVLILEDDAVLLNAGNQSIERFFDALPIGWRRDSMVYLGGQHRFLETDPPEPINDLVLQPFNVNRTHAYSVCGDMLPRLYQFLCDTNDWDGPHHIDHRFGELHQLKEFPVYCPTQWYFGQRAGYSDIATQNFDERSWRKT